MSIQSGARAECAARDYLIAKGLQWVESNFRCPMGEIDLIMRDGIYFVFVEVRARSSNAFGGALMSITKSKKQKILKSALAYLQTKKYYEKYPIRFDVCCFEGGEAEIVWIKNAFGNELCT